ncbi:hypothetical protein PG988_008016 [Apiospora saccharicola]
MTDGCCDLCVCVVLGWGKDGEVTLSELGAKFHEMVDDGAREKVRSWLMVTDRGLVLDLARRVVAAVDFGDVGLISGVGGRDDSIADGLDRRLDVLMESWVAGGPVDRYQNRH